MEFIAVLAQTDSSSHQIASWFQILIACFSLVGSVLYVGMKIGRMETRLDNHLITIEQIGTHIENSAIKTEAWMKAQSEETKSHDRQLNIHEVRISGLDIQIGHLEQMAVAPALANSQSGVIRKGRQ